MKYKKESIVEVFCNQSWRCAPIVSSEGHNYTVSYDVYPGFTSKDDVEQISVKSIRPCPPLLGSSESWAPGDVTEVFHNLSWKMAIVLKDFGPEQFMVRLVGSLQEFEVTKSELRVRQSYQNGQWIVTGKVPSDHKKGKAYINRTSGYESSSGSCSISSYKPFEPYHGSGFCVEDIEDHESDAESVCQCGYHEESKSQETMYQSPKRGWRMRFIDSSCMPTVIP